MSDVLKTQIEGMNRVMLQALKSGQEMGIREGMLRAAMICDAAASLHAKYLPPDHYYTMGDHAQAATCGRRDEAKVLADKIRADINTAISALHATQEVSA